MDQIATLISSDPAMPRSLGQENLDETKAALETARKKHEEDKEQQSMGSSYLTRGALVYRRLIAAHRSPFKSR